MRYKPEYSKKGLKHPVVERSQKVLETYINVLLTRPDMSEEDVIQSHVIVFVVDINDIDELAGVLRNIHLADQYLPLWSIRVYIKSSIQRPLRTKSTINNTYSDLNVDDVRNMYLNHIRRAGAEVFKQNPELNGTESSLIEHLIRDASISRMLLRSARSRLLHQEASVIRKWLHQEEPILCITDHNPTCSLSINKNTLSESMRSVVIERSNEKTFIGSVRLIYHNMSNQVLKVEVKQSSMSCDQYEQCA